MHCDRNGHASSEDVVLGSARTLGFIELQGPIPTPGPLPEPWVADSQGEPTSPASTASDAGMPVITLAQSDSDSDAGAPIVRPVPTWPVQALRPARARGIDQNGHRFALMDDAVVDEQTDHRVPLQRDDIHCERRRESLQFNTDGAGYLLREGRVFVRAPAMDLWVRTPVCNDVEGMPWAFAPDKGWFTSARRTRAPEVVVLTTPDIDGSFGWNALQGMRGNPSAVVLETDLSQTALIDNHLPLFVNNERFVAGPIPGTARTPFGGITRNRVGVVVWRDVAEYREVFYSHDARGPFTRRMMHRASGLTAASNATHGVWATDGGAFVAVTRLGVEYCDDFEGAEFQRVARWPAPLLSNEGIDVGFSVARSVLVVTPVAMARNGL